MSLHLVFSTAGWRACEQRLGADDVVVLLGDGVYAPAHVDTGDARVLQQDLDIRGVRKPQNAVAIDYPDLVELCTRYAPVVSWKD